MWANIWVLQFCYQRCRNTHILAFMMHYRICANGLLQRILGSGVKGSEMSLIPGRTTARFTNHVVINFWTCNICSVFFLMKVCPSLPSKMNEFYKWPVHIFHQTKQWSAPKVQEYWGLVYSCTIEILWKLACTADINRILFCRQNCSCLTIMTNFEIFILVLRP